VRAGTQDRDRMRDADLSRARAEHRFRQLLHDADLRQPDEVQPHEDGGIVCLSHEEKLAVVIDLEPVEGGEHTLPLESHGAAEAER
jgi:hypothetical protein